MSESRLPAAFLTPGSSSFADFLGHQAPDLLPGRRTLPAVGDPARRAARDDDRGRHVHRWRGDGRRPARHDGQHHRPARHREGLPGRRVLLRRHRRVRPASPSSWSGCSRSSSSTTRRSRASTLSLDGKANRLSALIRGNLAMAMQGLAVVPLFAGFDPDTLRRPDLLVRRHRRPLRGAGVPLGRARARCSPAGR